MVSGKGWAFLLLLAAVGMVAGTGAFSTVQADRTATVGTAGDDRALLQMTPYAGPGGNGAIADLEAGQIQISALNLASSTDFAKVLNVTNQGTQPVGVWIVDEGDHADAVTFYNPAFGGADGLVNGVASIEGEANAVTLDVGETLVVSMLVDTTGIGDGVSLIDTMIVHADATVDGNPGPGDGTGEDDQGEDEDEQGEDGNEQ